MAIPLNPELVPAIRARSVTASGGVRPRRGDAYGLRAIADPDLVAQFARLPASSTVTVTHHQTLASDGTPLPLRLYEPAGPRSGSAVVYVHGGGMISGTLDAYEPLVAFYVQASRVPFLAVDYRLAPEVRGTIPATDVASGVLWLLEHAADHRIDPARIAIMGDSAGGGLSAGAAIATRDAGFELARQILVYPMLDDRTIVPDPWLQDRVTWSHDDNFTGWSALLADERGTPTVSPIAAPARLESFDGLPPAYIEVGELDIFRDESIAYAQNLWRAGIACELHVHPGAPHGHDWLALDTDISRRVIADRVRVIESV